MKRTFIYDINIEMFIMISGAIPVDHRDRAILDKYRVRHTRDLMFI